MNLFLHQFFSGLAMGGVYASVALALVVIYQSTHVVNFAQGEMAMISTYLAWQLIAWGVPYWIAFVLTIVAAFVLGMALERAVIRRFSAQAPLAAVIAMIGLLVIINSVAGMLWGADTRSFQSPFEGTWTIGYLSSHELGALVVTLVVMGAVFLFFNRTRVGLAMRAAASNPTSASLVGVSVGGMLSLGWGLAAALGAVAGIMSAPLVYLDPNMMLGIIVYAFAGALLGGITNAWGAVVGGFLVGIFENLIGAYLVGTDLKLTAVLALIVVIVTVRPQGLFGRRVAARV